MTGSLVFALRPAEATDAEFLYGVFVASRERELTPLPPEMRDAVAKQQYRIQRNGLRAEYPDAQQLIVLGAAKSSSAAGDPVGMIILAERPDVLCVVDIALHPDHRNMGLGAAVLRSLMEECRQSGRMIKGSVTPYNPARRLYARLGIKELGASHGYISLEWRPE